MARRSLARPMIAAAWLCALSCSLVVDTSDVDQGCGPGRKLCGGECVLQSEKAYGCTPTGCDPCRLTNAIPACKDGTCVVESCVFGFDCPKDETSGCLINILVDKDNCGNCNTKCKDWETCSDGTCVAQARTGGED